MAAPARLIEAAPLVLRPWELADRDAMAAAVGESTEHLRPWMPWVAFEPLSKAARTELIEDFGRSWETEEAFVYGLFVAGKPVGGCGLHKRVGAGGLEIGYWVHPAWVGRGLASTAARALTEAAFELPEIERVEVRHDKANAASRRIPEKLGFELSGERPDEVTAAGEIGIECRWVMSRPRWSANRLSCTEP